MSKECNGVINENGDLICEECGDVMAVYMLGACHPGAPSFARMMGKIAVGRKLILSCAICGNDFMQFEVSSIEELGDHNGTVQ